jgi:hypothetical protein
MLELTNFNYLYKSRLFRDDQQFLYFDINKKNDSEESTVGMVWCPEYYDKTVINTHLEYMIFGTEEPDYEIKIPGFIPYEIFEHTGYKDACCFDLNIRVQKNESGKTYFCGIFIPSIKFMEKYSNKKEAKFIQVFCNSCRLILCKNDIKILQQNLQNFVYEI